MVGDLYRIERDEVEPLLISLLDDPVLDYFATAALARSGGRAALEALASIELASRSPRTRKQVPKVIERIRRRLAAV